LKGRGFSRTAGVLNIVIPRGFSPEESRFCSIYTSFSTTLQCGVPQLYDKSKPDDLFPSAAKAAFLLVGWRRG
jgi:hypothetical protein